MEEGLQEEELARVATRPVPSSLAWALPPTSLSWVSRALPPSSHDPAPRASPAPSAAAAAAALWGGVPG